MATSNTYAFQPSLGDLVLYAYGMCGVRRTAILAEHMVDARMACNLMQADWAVDGGPNLWTVELEELPLVEGQATYPVDPSTVMILDTYIRIYDGAGTPIDRIILPVTREDYAAYSDKLKAGRPTAYWFDRQIAPTITLWPVPDNDYLLRYYRFRQIQDAELINGLDPEVPYRFLSAYAMGLAQRLSLIYAPTKYALLKAEAMEAWERAATQDTEGNVSITPGISGYFR